MKLRSAKSSPHFLSRWITSYPNSTPESMPPTLQKTAKYFKSIKTQYQIHIHNENSKTIDIFPLRSSHFFCLFGFSTAPTVSSWEPLIINHTATPWIRNLESQNIRFKHYSRSLIRHSNGISSDWLRSYIWERGCRWEGHQGWVGKGGIEERGDLGHEQIVEWSVSWIWQMKIRLEENADKYWAAMEIRNWLKRRSTKHSRILG